MAAETTANRAHNKAMMDAAGVPQAARRGFYVASGYGHMRFAEIRQDGSHWIVTSVIAPGAYTQYGYIVGPRGKVRKVY